LSHQTISQQPGTWGHEFLARLTRAVNEDAFLSESQQGELMNWIEGVLNSRKSLPKDLEAILQFREVLTLAMYVNTCH